MKHRSLLLGLLAALVSANALALPEDRSQPIQISADQAELDDRQGVATYRGEVKLTQGSLNIEAETLTIRSDGNGIQHLTAVGKPAHYSQQPVAGAPLTHGYGLRIEYDIPNSRLAFIAQARLERAGDSFQSERIEIDIARDIVNASSGDHRGPDATKQRVEMVIQPRSSAQ